MAATPSTMQMTIGAAAPDFALTDAVTGRTVRRDDYTDAPALLVLFICNHCPFVIHVRDELARIADAYADRGVATVAINANDADAYPQDGPEAMRALARELGWPFPYLFDPSQEVAKAYGAACTPDIFLFDGEGRLFYRGQLDSSRPSNDIPTTGKDLRGAIEALLAGEAPPDEQRPSLGCNIKWRPGNAPAYAS